MNFTMTWRRKHLGNWLCQFLFTYYLMLHLVISDLMVIDSCSAHMVNTVKIIRGLMEAFMVSFFVLKNLLNFWPSLTYHRSCGVH